MATIAVIDPPGHLVASTDGSCAGRAVALADLDAQQLLASAQLLCEGLRRKQLHLAFQPLVPLRRSPAFCFEVHSHLHSPRGTIAGNRLYGAARKHGLAETLDRAVILRSLAWLRQPGCRTLVLIVGLSRTSLLSQRFRDWLTSQLQRGPHPGRRLLLRISAANRLTGQPPLTAYSRAAQGLRLSLAISQVGMSKDLLTALPPQSIALVMLDARRLHNLAADDTQFAALQARVSELHRQHIKVAAGQLKSLELLPLFWRARLDFIQGRSLQTAASRPILRCVRERVFAGPENSN